MSVLLAEEGLRSVRAHAQRVKNCRILTLDLIVLDYLVYLCFTSPGVAIFSCFTLVVSPIQKASLIEKSRQKPQERIKTLTNAVGNNSYDHDPVLAACGIYVEKTRVLEPPKTLLQPSHIDYWAVVNFSARCEMIMVLSGSTKYVNGLP
ncbi:hypothetical protein Ahy_A05g024478 [Arachis hypogaea]|uniref:Uncharacterized protein n=1 Tax=Arachis hypogaea TaxID=3818 RepID=A0A445D5Y3_ARAHY|nr:hypothetical protein Ahy_A05g024478 [Arachis hypogaea]